MPAITLEQKVAGLVDKINAIFEGEDGFEKVRDRVKAVAEELGVLKELDLKTTVQEVNKLKAQNEVLTNLIRTSKSGLYVPGLEDKSFSILKTMLAIRSGDWTNAEQEKEIMDAVRAKAIESKASQNIGDDTYGGYFVPDQVIPDVIQAIYKNSVLINLSGEGETRATVLDGLTGGNVKIPKFDGGLVAYWIGEEDEYAESRSAVGDVSLNPKKLGILVKLTDSMRRFQGFGFENLLRQDMIRAAAAKLDWSMIFGSGTDDMPRGILNHTAIKIFDAASPNAAPATPAVAEARTNWLGAFLGVESLAAIDLALEEDDVAVGGPGFATISSPRFFHKVKTEKIENYSAQTAGNPFMIGIPSIPDSRLSDLIGEWGKSNQMPSNEEAGSSIGGNMASADALQTTVIRGDLSQLVLGRWGGIEIEDDSGKGKGFTSDHTYLKLRMYADCVIRQERAIVACPNALVR